MTYLDTARVEFDWEFPLAEIILDFFDKLKTISRGYATLDYEMLDYRASDLVKLDMLINGDPIDAFSVIIHRDKAYDWGRKIADKLKELIPRQLFEVAIQAAIGNKIIARTTVKPLRKDVLAKCYGGDITAQAQAPREAEGGKEADEAGGLRGDSAGSVPRGAAGGLMALAAATGPHQLVVQTSFLGDIVLTTPLHRGARRAGPVDVVVTPASAPLLARNPDVRELIVYDKRGRRRGAARLSPPRAARARARRARGGAARVAYLAQGSLRSACARPRRGLPAARGIRQIRRPDALHARVPYREDRHHAERLWRLAFPGRRARRKPRRLCARASIPGDAERAAVDALLGAARRAPARRARARKRLGHEALAVLRGARRATRRALPARDRRRPGRPRRPRSIAETAGPQGVVDATGTLSLLASAELIGRARCWSPTTRHPSIWRPPWARRRSPSSGRRCRSSGSARWRPIPSAVGLDALACRPCDKHGPPRCPLGHWQCMRELIDAVASRCVACSVSASAIRPGHMSATASQHTSSASTSAARTSSSARCRPTGAASSPCVRTRRTRSSEPTPSSIASRPWSAT